jgi:hypothetical protein
MANAGLFLLAVVLIILAGGQFQYAYYFVRLKDLLKENLSNKQEHRFITHNGEDAIATKYYGGYYIAILTDDGFDKIVFVVLTDDARSTRGSLTENGLFYVQK